MTLGLLLILLAILGFALLAYHRLNNQIETIHNNHQQIDRELNRRFKTFDSLIKLVKKYMNVDETTLKEVITLRKKAEAAERGGDEKTRMDAENQISTIASSINILFDQYPDLKTNPNAMHLRKDIVNIENSLAYAKEAYNDSIEIYHINKTSFPASILVPLFRNKLDFTFPYWQLKLQKAKVQSETSYTVQL